VKGIPPSTALQAITLKTFNANECSPIDLFQTVLCVDDFDAGFRTSTRSHVRRPFVQHKTQKSCWRTRRSVHEGVVVRPTVAHSEGCLSPANQIAGVVAVDLKLLNGLVVEEALSLNHSQLAECVTGSEKWLS
jgi:hypothetical protein